MDSTSGVLLKGVRCGKRGTRLQPRGLEGYLLWPGTTYMYDTLSL